VSGTSGRQFGVGAPLFRSGGYRHFGGILWGSGAGELCIWVWVGYGDGWGFGYKCLVRMGGGMDVVEYVGWWGGY